LIEPSAAGEAGRALGVMEDGHAGLTFGFDAVTPDGAAGS